jgi:hypothetical protein
MKTTRMLYASIVLCTILVSCSIQKRQHLPGYHISWRGSHEKQPTGQIINETPELTKQEPDTGVTKTNPTPAPEPTSIAEQSETTPTTKKQELKPTTKENDLAENKPHHHGVEALRGIFRPTHAESPKVNETSDDTVEYTAVAGFLAILLAYGLVFISGYIGIVSSLAFLPFLLGLAAVVLAIIALVRIRESNKSGKGLAIATLVLCVLPFFIALILIMLFLASFY